MAELQKTIEEGLIPFGIDYDDERLSQMCGYVESLEKWNRRVNLVGLKEQGPIVRELIYDAFFLFTCMVEGDRILDLGSGAGVLGVPMAILGRGKTVFSVDRTLRKVQFQRHVKRLLGLSNYTVLHARIEDVEPPLGVDILVAKAFGSISEVLAKGRKHVIEGGRFFLVRGRGETPTDEEGFILIEKRRYRLPKSDKEYQLFVYKKVP
jgi:16S rRNA (guanine527-N7)-methyltransferase